MRFMLYVEIITVLNYDLFLFDGFLLLNRNENNYGMKVGVGMYLSSA